MVKLNCSLNWERRPLLSCGLFLERPDLFVYGKFQPRPLGRGGQPHSPQRHLRNVDGMPAGAAAEPSGPSVVGREVS